ncbi:penicillin-binding protein 1C [Orbus sturtevantii]|uniref:penicillin-binding protein 1C n=1 Tax=Orbus sturtevantii TaxID=3074109 RepID=UPI00370DA1AC
MSIIINFIKRRQNSLMVLLLFVIVVLAVRLYPHPPLSKPLSFSNTYYDANNKLLRITLAEDERYRLWTPLAQISPNIINSLLLHEDQWFYYHPGFNPISLIRAFFATYIGSGNRQGASTITMQLARMHWKLNTKSIDGKLIQLVRAIQLELMYSKNDILEAYLNYAPFGRNIESVGAASLIYFDKPASAVNLPEALTLTVLPQSPTFRIDKQTGVAGKALTNARNQLFQRWQETYLVDDKIAALFYQPLTMRQPEQLPFIAPHFINQIIQQQLSERNQSNIITTLDSNLQTIIQDQVNIFIERNQQKGIQNASVLLVDSQTMAVKALLGSADYFNNQIQGQVNGTLAKRSPGSTLKPFIYALGIDQGVLHPMSILKDVETDFGFYTPENFDRNFKGPISATEALIRSRNIPAVFIASKLKTPSFYQFLTAANIQNLASEEHYGLALVLGGGEVTSQELASLYAMLENQGKWQPLRFTAKQTNNQSTIKQLLSPEASFMAKDMLRQNTRKQDILFKKQNTALPIYFKTGTSWGFRDAWTAGGFKQYILIVWLGNFDGTSNNAFVGADAATPLFFNIIDAINNYYPNTQAPRNELPKNMKKVDICLTSGNLVTKWCKVKGKTWFIPGVSPITVDNIYRPIMVDNKTGAVACPPYNPQTSHVEVFEYWPSDLAKIFAKAGVPKKSPPDSSHCLSPQNYLGQSPNITSPLKNVVYQFRINNQNNERISLNANVDGEVKQVYWFIDNQFIGNSPQNQPLEWLPNKSGLFRLLVVDDLGRSDSRAVKVELLE